MAYQMKATNQIGAFQERDWGHWFEYSENPETILSPLAHGGKNVRFPHIVWVGNGYRYAIVKKTCVHIITDETSNGWVVEKWDLKNHNAYVA